MSKGSQFVSIIIPVYNDVVRLTMCLEALSVQTYPDDSFEVIVVDNCSEEDIKSLVSQFACAKYTFESSPGSYAARNQGLSIAKGDLLGFTDADCKPASDWIANGVRQLIAHPEAGLIAGRIDFYFQKPDRPTVAELFDSQTFLKQQHYVENDHYGATANLFTFRHMFDQVGLFNTQLKSGGDREWGKRVYAAGYLQVYADDVRIAHPARHRVQDLKTKVLRVVEGQYFTGAAAKKSLIPALGNFIIDAKPYLGYATKTLKTKENGNFGYKLGLIYVHIVLRYTRAWKKLQLNFK